MGGYSPFFTYEEEVFFYLPSQSTAIQVCYDLSDAITVQRETQALQKLSTVVPLERMLIITRDEERTFTLSSGQTIEAIPVWKWLID